MDTWDCISFWALAQWLGVSIETAAELAHHGAIPPPVSTSPILWSLADLEQWAAAGCPVREVQNDTKFKPAIYLRARKDSK